MRFAVKSAVIREKIRIWRFENTIKNDLNCEQQHYEPNYIWHWCTNFESIMNYL